jgi:hypothetical protein
VAEVENVSCNAVKEDMNFRIDQDIFWVYDAKERNRLRLLLQWL